MYVPECSYRITLTCHIQGRLGDLGVIDDKYDVAVTTACPTLNHLIVDSVKQGEACIDFLRKGNIGRANIMVLEKLPQKAPNPIQTPENVPRLFDLIKPKDPRFAPAFYKGLGNTLVANDLEQAQRIGFGSSQRWRVVTLGGQLIDPSGTMSGGGNRVARGGMSSKFKADKVAPEVVVKLEKESADAEAELQKFQEEKKAIESEVVSLKRRLPEIEMEMEKIELDVSTATKRIVEAEKRLSELKYVANSLVCLKLTTVLDPRASLMRVTKNVSRLSTPKLPHSRRKPTNCAKSLLRSMTISSLSKTRFLKLVEFVFVPFSQRSRLPRAFLILPTNLLPRQKLVKPRLREM